MEVRASVVIPSHSERRWDSLVRTIESVLTQRPAPDRVIVVVDHNEGLFERVERELPHVVAVRNESAPGASGTRNTGVRHTDSPVIALLDDDTRAHPGWLAGLLAPFADPRVIGTGGAIRPEWAGGRGPGWFPPEFLWVVGASFAGMPTTRAVVRNVWSGSMAVRRDAFTAVGGFDTGFGKVGGRARPEDTDLCIRMAEATGGQWVYVPDAIVDHIVPAERGALRFFIARCGNEGRGKVELARLDGGRRRLGRESGYLRALPAAVARGIWDAARGRGMTRAAQAGMIVAGVTAALLGAAAGLVSPVASRRSADPGEREPATDERTRGVTSR